MSFLIEPLTGYANSNMLIRYVSTWTPDIFDRNFRMKFFKGPIIGIVDVSISGNNTLLIGKYPHNKSYDIKALVTKHEPAIRKIIQENRSSSVYEDKFTINLEETGVKLVTAADFANYYPLTTSDGELFIFTGLGSDQPFPRLFFADSSQRTGFQRLFVDVFAHSSHSVIKPTERGTNVGKTFTYMFLASCVMNKFQGKSSQAVPDMLNIVVPSSGVEGLPSQLNVDVFTTLMKGPRIPKLVMKDGKEVIEETSAGEIVEEVDEDEDDDEVGTKTVHSLVSSKSSEDSIVNSVLAGIPINLTDMMNYGIMELLILMGNLDKVVEVFPDIPQIASRMCIFQGKVHMIPYNPKMDVEEVLGEPQDLFVFCSANNFPKEH